MKIAIAELERNEPEIFESYERMRAKLVEKNKRLELGQLQVAILHVQTHSTKKRR